MQACGLVTDHDQSVESKGAVVSDDPCSTTTVIRQLAERLHQQVISFQARTLLLMQVNPDRPTAVRLLELACELGSRRDETVLLVDAEPRRRDLTLELNFQDTPGLTECFGTGQPVTSLVRPRVRQRLDVLPMGRGRMSVGDGLTDVVAKTVRRLAQNRLVIFAAGGPECLVCRGLLPASDIAVLVLKKGVTTYRQTKLALQSATAATGRTIGSILA